MFSLKKLIDGVFGNNQQPAPPPAPAPQPLSAPPKTVAPKAKEKPAVSFDFLVNSVTPLNAQNARECFKTLLDDGLVVTQEMKKRIYNQAPALAPLVPDVQDALTIRDALANGDADSLRDVLARGVDFEAGMAYGAQPAIVTAAKTGDVAVIDLLLAHGASVQTKVSGDSRTLPLNQAAMHGQRDAFLRFLDAGANPNFMWSDHDGFWTVNGMAKKCKTDPGMAAFVESVLEARESKVAPAVSVDRVITARRPITLKTQP